MSAVMLSTPDGYLERLSIPGGPFSPVLEECLARGRRLFKELSHTAESGGFSIPVACSKL